MGARRRARERALQALYRLDLAGGTSGEALSDVIGLIEGGSSDEIKAFADRIINGVADNLEAIDEVIQGSSLNWRLARMAVVDRNVLRLAAFELLYCEDIPRKVTLNEAIEVGKRYGSEDSGAFINGVLDRIARSATKD